ncbi:hypothetical protein ZEAMMB73_Zm00001d043138 [Zea mays]|uniref:Uncharacterized protein n=1 Tax=Zea mays TaxID=4577 RepID=A0A1D6N974_MAIZE|nr:hypothetical protein ZEAMMB73_Zm00001d043138 [Zea mays]
MATAELREQLNALLSSMITSGLVEHPIMDFDKVDPYVHQLKGSTPGPTIVVQLCLSTPFREEMATGSNNSSTSVAMGHEVQTIGIAWLPNELSFMKLILSKARLLRTLYVDRNPDDFDNQASTIHNFLPFPFIDEYKSSQFGQSSYAVNHLWELCAENDIDC